MQFFLPTVSKSCPSLSSRWLGGWWLGLVVVLLGALPAAAQLNYTTSSSLTTTWTSIYGAGGSTSLLPDLQNGDPDDDITFDEPIGFNFNFQGGNYSRFILSTNGFITLGTTSPDYYGGTGATSTSGSILRQPEWQNNHSLAVFNIDVEPGNQGQNDYLYKLTGTVGNRILTVEWHDVGEYTGAGYPARQFNSFSFQVKLYEGTNQIEYVYGPMIATANTATAKVANVGIRGESTLPGQLLFLSKASGTAWSAATVGVTPAGGYGGGLFAVNAFNYRNSVLPAAGQTYRFTPTTANTNNVSVGVYTQAQLANPQGMPHTVQARLTNETGVANGPFNVHLDVAGTLTVAGNPTPFHFTDDQSVTLPGFAGDPRPQISFLPYSVPSGATGSLTVTVTAQNAGDQVPADNTATATTTVSSTDDSYATGATITGGSGFTGAYGEFVARFHTAAAQQLTGAQVEFTTTGRDYQLIVLDDDGLNGTPNTVLYQSAIMQTQSTASVAILPALTVSGDFFVGIRQTSTNNAGFSYETESPIRSGVFYYRGSAAFPITALWNDYATAGSPFRLRVGVSFAIPQNQPPSCALTTSPANNATGVLTAGQLQFGSNGGSPTGYDVYLSTNQTAVQNEDPAARVATNQAATTYNYSGLAALTSYYYKVVARNANGPAANCPTVVFTTAPVVANDNCAAATTLLLKAFGSCGAGTAGTTIGALEDAIADPSCASGDIRDVWYKFSTGTATAVNVYVTPGSAGGGLGMQVFSACGVPVAGVCSANVGAGVPVAGLAAGSTYWLRIYTNVSAGGTPGTFSVCVSGPAVPVPTVSAFTPASGVTGTSVTLTGTNFTGATGVTFNGVAASGFTVNSATSITVTVPAGAGTGKIAVSTPSGVGTSAGTFKVVPTLTSFSQALGAPGTVLTLTGSGLTGATSVKFNGVAATTFAVINAATISVTVPALATTGKISVTTPGGMATTTAVFTVAPIITGFTPGQGAPGSVVVVAGLNFISGSAVQFHGVAATTTYNSAKQLTAVVPAGATSGPLTVTNANGTTTSATSFTVTSGAVPTITSFTPTSGVLGTVVTINGTNFSGATSVRFNTTSTSVTVLSATQVQAAVPTGATTGKLYVVTPAGMAQSASSFTVILPPTITSLSPGSGARGSSVTINGSNFTNASSVTIGGAVATFTITSSAKIVATVPTAAVTGTITVTTVAGTATSAGTFTVTGPRPAGAASPEAALPPTLVAYPSPARDWVAVELTGAPTPTAPVELFNSLGQVVRRGALTDGATRLSVAGLPVGRYVLRAAGLAQPLLVGE